MLLDGKGGHYGYPRFGSVDVGGNFGLRYVTASIKPTSVGTIRGTGGFSDWSYHGDVIGVPGYMLDPVPFVDGADWGATAYARMKPDRPNFQALNAIYELRELPGMFQQRFLSNGLNAIGDYYLALKFGWEPLLRDIRNFVLTQMNAQKTLQQLLRDEGRPVRRKIILADTSRELGRLDGSGYQNLPTFVTQFYNGVGTSRYVDSQKDKIWAAAQFKYWLPPGPRDVNWTRAMKARIFGLYPSPAVVWNALPWTWLIDWFANVGDVLSNMQTTLADRCAADYFYVMHHAEYHRVFTTTQSYFQDKTFAPITVTCNAELTSGSKSRSHGDPFGFATPEANLSGVQLSILGALGLSRLR
jgi:hypothetical protein